MKESMCAMRALLILLACTVIAACRIEIVVPEGGYVTSESGDYSCTAGRKCIMDVVDIFFDETFQAIPDSGHSFKQWKKREKGLCGGQDSPCRLATTGFGGNADLMAILDSEAVFWLEPVFEQSSEEPTKKVGFEIIEIQSPNSIRAWISPDITFDEFAALELPQGWIKNQPRESAECGADTVRFTRSPDSTEDGDILLQEFFGFNWFHAATITEMNIGIDEDGLLEGTTVRKFHELTYNAGSCLVLLISPEEEVYFRIGRDANRVSDEPAVPNTWRLEEYTTPEKLVIKLFEENLVIRTDNEDSFQGPVPELGVAL